MGVAQQITGTILGTVKDVSGGVISSAAVTVTNEDTNITSKAATGANGDYVASNLPPGTYTVTTEFTGFKKNTVKGVRLLATRTARIDVVLDPGDLAQSVEVQATAPVVNSENATVGTVMDGKLVTALPLNGRTIDGLLGLVAGSTGMNGSNPRIAGSAYFGGVQFNVDGVNFNDSGNGGSLYSARTGLSTLPSIESIAEFKVDVSNQKAEFEAAATVTIVSKSGSNEYHGAVFAFNRNKVFAANVPLVPADRARAPFNRNEFGFAMGGPVIKNRTFFFGNYEGLRQRSPTNNRLSVATAAMRDGDFSGLPAIVDPLNGVPFANNRVPVGRIDSRSKTLIGSVPLPNQPGIGPAGTLNNWIGDTANVIDVNRFGPRLDHRFSGKDSIWGSFTYSKGWPYFIARGVPPNYGNSVSSTLTKSVNITHLHSFSPNTMNEFRFAQLRHGFFGAGQNSEFDPKKLFPDLYGPLPYGGLPRIDISNHIVIGDRGGTAFRGSQFTTQYIENFTHVRGRHTFKAGFDIDRFTTHEPPYVYGLAQDEANDAGLGRFSFNGRYTNNDLSKAAQPAHAFADFLLGYPVNTYRSTVGGNAYQRLTRYSAYFQDDWQVSRRLTLNLGVRYMVQTPWSERDGNQANFDFNTGKLVVAGDKFPSKTLERMVSAYPIVTAAKAGLTGDFLETDKNNLGPRLGFAFRPFVNGKTVVRGGAGIYYNFIPVFLGHNQLSTSNAPFVLAENFESDPSQTPSLTLASPFPGAGKLSPNPSITAVERNLKNSESQQWNLSMERDLGGNLGVRASYVGNKISHLPYVFRNINEPKGQMAGATQPRRPYQPWASISMLYAGGDSSFHQLQLEAIQRNYRGLSFQVEYSWNKSLDNTPLTGGTMDPYDNRRDRGNSQGIRRHVFNAASNYELPFGPGKALVNVSGPLGKIVGGWQAGAILSLLTGSPFSAGFSATQPGWLGGRPNMLRNPTLSRSERTPDRWFDTSAFAVPAPYTYGNSSRNMLFGPGTVGLDLSLVKDTKISERFTAQLRGEFFNLANHANLGSPGTNLSVPATFGKVTSASGSRQIQFGMKLLF
jgi:hypothetical protein